MGDLRNQICRRTEEISYEDWLNAVLYGSTPHSNARIFHEYNFNPDEPRDDEVVGLRVDQHRGLALRLKTCEKPGALGTSPKEIAGVLPLTAQQVIQGNTTQRQAADQIPEVMWIRGN